MRYVWSVLAFVAFLCFSSGASCGASNESNGRNVVLWISVDGFRGDYVDRGKTPFLRSLIEHGLYSREMVPVFPSLTFPSHVSEATGVLPGVHGIVSNRYLDTTTGELFNLSILPQALRAEPIWFTATRQGVRTAVIDWPLSEGQDQLPADTPRTAYFNVDFDPGLTDRERLKLLVDKYRGDFNRPESANSRSGLPLRLLMGYGCAVDKAGHQMGPTSGAVDAAVGDMDQLLKDTVNEVSEVFQRNMNPGAGDALWVLVTTDHGMSDVKQMVNLRHLMGGDDVPESVVAHTSGGLAHIYFHQVPASQREAALESVLARLRKVPFGKVWRREELPADWGYDAPGRTGDLVFSMDQGYAFTWHDDVKIVPVESDRDFPRGMHSYDPAENKEMLGFFLLARLGSTAPGRDVGRLDSLRIHPTVAKLLAIEPAAGATAKPLDTSYLAPGDSGGPPTERPGLQSVMERNP